MSDVTGLQCRECGASFPRAALHVCDECFGPLEVQYDYAQIAARLSRSVIEARPRNLWRYRRPLPVERAPVVGPHSGFTPLVKADRLARALGIAALAELRQAGLIDAPAPRIYTAQAAGCAPAMRALHSGRTTIEPVKPDTIAKSIAIGNPADGYYVLEDVRASGGWGEAATDEEIVAAIQLLARTEGIFTKPTGGTTVVVTKKLIEQGRIPRDESVVISITGNGYKTLEAVAPALERLFVIEPRRREFDSLYESLGGAPLASATIGDAAIGHP